MNWLAYLCVVMFSGLFCSTSFAQDSNADHLKIQGEYVGKKDSESEQAIPMGGHLIDVGDNNFQLALYIGGLPGEGWSGEAGRRAELGPAPLKDGKITFDMEGEQFVFENGSIKALGDGKIRGELKRVERKSETLGAAPPEDAVILFDGTSGDNFVLRRGDGEPMVDGLLRQGIASKEKFGGDFKLHIEFKLPFEPTKSGQGRGNSGIYLQGRYEVQMLDSFGLTGEHNECGGIYSVKKPDVNMCYPPESWQTYDIDFTSAKFDGDKKVANARMTVLHNGVLIHDDVEVPKTTTAAPLKETSEPGFIFLQDHGSPVRYRNIWVLKK